MISEKQFKRIIEPHRRGLEKLRLELGYFIEDIGNIDVYGIHDRIKSWESATKKSQTLNVPVEQLDDLAGLRIIVGTQAEIPIVERFFSRQENENDLTILKRRVLSKPDGYHALHMVIDLKGQYQTTMHNGRLEVQLQTVFEHAFNFLSRSWKYKQQHETSHDWNERFVKISEKLLALERDATELHSHLTGLVSNDDNALLSPYSYKILVGQEFGEDVTLNDAVDSCRFYSNLNCKTNGQMRQFFRNPEIQQMYDQVSTNSTNEAAQIIMRMGKNGFWMLFGTRLTVPGAKEFLTSLLSMKKQENV